jgi:uncharacterized protein YggE
MNDKSQKQTISISILSIYKISTIILALIIITMLVLWQPWKSIDSQDRSISVNGEAMVKAAPDQYVFNPSYEFKNYNKDKALAEQTDKNNQIVTGLKELGVKDSEIKNNSGGYSYGYTATESDRDETIYNLLLTITVSDKDLAQKVQGLPDYH